MRVAVLHNAVSQQDTIEDRDVLVQVNAVLDALKRIGHERHVVACTLDLESMKKKLDQLRPDVIFNLIEALQGDDSLVYLPPAVFDSLKIPYTGGHTESLLLTTNKLLAKERLFNAGLPTPPWILSGVNSTSDGYFYENNPCDDQIAACKEASARWIIKGVWDQGSRDMEDEAVFEGNAAEVGLRLKKRIDRTHRPAFAEQFIEGREFNIAILSGSDSVDVLPPAEIDFSAYPREKPRIVGYRAKWESDSFEYHNTPRTFDFPESDKPLLDSLNSLTHRCWNLFMLHGWARVDFRVDCEGRPWILEVNANPCLSPDSGFAAALKQADISFDTAIQRIINDVRTGNRAPVCC
jgi:D-alanine-D-alanine ligase